MSHRVLFRLTQLLLLVIAGIVHASEEQADLALHQGASTYIERCALCHGSNGGGEGVLSMSIRGYPDTNLLGKWGAGDYGHIRETIEDGGITNDENSRMPPWIDELTADQIDAVTRFIVFLNHDLVAAQQLLAELSPSVNFDSRGPALFATRCALCHGSGGEGDGRMARIIKEPSPYNLTGSRVPPQYIRLIVREGGEALGRSKRMPPFGKDLMPWEVDSLIEHVLDLRKQEI